MEEYFQLIRSYCFAYDRRIRTAPRLMTHRDCEIASALYYELARMKGLSKQDHPSR